MGLQGALQLLYPPQCISCSQPVQSDFGLCADCWRETPFIAGLVCGSIGLIATALTHSVGLFALSLVPLALGIGFGHPTMSSLVSRAARGDEQGRVQGAASAVESLGRTIGPVWGSATLQRFGEGVPYVTAAGFLLLTLLLSIGYQVPESVDGT